VWPNPVVEVNRAVALAFAAGPARGLAALDDLVDEPGLASWHYLPAARADLLRRLGRDAEAVTAYRAALELVPDGPERGYLERRLHEVEPAP
jgi:RNA polymerase sigma-70 factor (ECF subfamily)